MLGVPLALALALRVQRGTTRSPWLPGIGLGAYALSIGLVPPLLSAAVGMLSLSASVSTLCLGRRFCVPLAAALLLSLPVEASLQFYLGYPLSVPMMTSLHLYLGYPLRFVVASWAAAMLSTLGLDVSALGTQLSWHLLVVDVDGPCSGVRMLRTALLFSALLGLLGERRLLSFALHLAFSVVALVLANALRATSLFLIELTAAPFPWPHAAVGVCAFALLLWAQYAARTPRAPWLRGLEPSA